MSKNIFLGLALALLLVLGSICLFLFIGAYETFKNIGVFEFLFSKDYYPSQEIFGVFSMLVNTLLISFLSLLLASIIGGFCSIYIVFFAKAKIKSIFTFILSILSMIPSVLYGFFALVVIVPFIASISNTSGKGFLSALIILSIMILPTIILLFSSYLDAVNKDYFKASLALGLSRQKSIIIMLRAGFSGILTALVLALARAIGEAMAVVMVAGNQVQIPSTILEGFRTLSANIVLEMGYAANLHKSALIASGFVLFMMILLINVFITFLKDKNVKN